MGQLNDLLREAKRATIIKVARGWCWDHVFNSGMGKPASWWALTSVQYRRAQIEAAQARVLLRRYLRKAGLPTDSPLVPQRP